jgi:glycosyltransferase 2 family protein
VRRTLPFAAAGLLAIVLLVRHYDVSALGRALVGIGVMGPAAVAVINFVPMALCAGAWRGLLPDSSGLRAFLWFRYTRDAASDLLGFIPAAGELAALQQMTRFGIEGRTSVPLLIADLTLQMIAQLVFTVAGVALLFAISPNGPVMRTAFVGLLLLAAILVAFISVQRWGVGRMLAALARRVLPGAVPGDGMFVEFDARLGGIYADRRRVAVSTTLHTAAWFIGISEAGLILSLMGAWPGLKVVLVLESLAFALRTAAFFVPAAWGVQEAAYVLVGSVFGLAPETMLALALVKRARELAVGVPVLVVGQTLSGFPPFARKSAGPRSDGRFTRSDPAASAGKENKSSGLSSNLG